MCMDGPFDTHYVHSQRILKTSSVDPMGVTNSTAQLMERFYFESLGYSYEFPLALVAVLSMACHRG